MNDNTPSPNAVIAPDPERPTFGRVRIFTVDAQVGDYDLIYPWDVFVQIFMTQQCAIVRSAVFNRQVIVKMFEIVENGIGGNVIGLHSTTVPGGNA